MGAVNSDAGGGGAPPVTPLSVLILSPDPSVHGGVSTLIEAMKSRFVDTKADALWVGSVQGRKESVLRQTWRLFSLPVRAACRARSGRYDVIHLNPSLDAKSVLRDGLILLALRLIRFRRVLVYVHGWQPELARRIGRSVPLRRVFVRLLSGTGRVLVLSPDFEASLIAMGVPAAKVATTRTFFDGAGLRAVPAVAASPPTILFMSRFVREKGVHELLSAFAALAGDYPDVVLVLAGDGPEAAALKQQAAALGLEKRVRFPGYVEGEAKFALLAACTLYALPTYYPEGMPVALLEAMGAGKPLLTAKAGVIPHIIHEPENGVVLSTVTAATVESGLRALLSDPVRCRETGERNRHLAWERYEAVGVTAEIERLYHEIAAHG